jgi:hypothetical protein
MTMSEEERDALFDQLPLTSMVIWDPDDELEHFQHADLKWWMDECLKHPHAKGRGYCKTCGPATTCMAGAFTDALVSSTIRELDRLNLLRPLKSPVPQAHKDEGSPVARSRGFTVHSADGQVVVRGIQFPSGSVVCDSLDGPGIMAATSVQALVWDWQGATYVFDDEETADA